MRWTFTQLPWVLCLAACLNGLAMAAPRIQTVCTITVNSADEKEVFRRYLPTRGTRFVELVERGRPDWLSSACRASTACDVLLISGHFDGSSDFFSDQLDATEYLPINELERVSCSASCPALFARLKEVHLYGCNTLNPEPLSSASAEVVRSLVREGLSLNEAQRQLRHLNAGHGESSHQRMRRIFKDVPVIYGFSSVAPLGPVAADALNRYFRQAGAREIGQGRVSSRLLRAFAPFGMNSARGMTDRDPFANVRRDVCRFVDDRQADTQKLGFVHTLLQRPMAQTRVHLDRIQALVDELARPERLSSEVDHMRATIAADEAARDRFLSFARDADQPAVRSRMLRLARDLGWLTEQERREELRLMLDSLQARPRLGMNDVDLVCTLNPGHELDGSRPAPMPLGAAEDDVAHAAVRACLGSHEARQRTLQGLTSTDPEDVLMARAYLRHRPIRDPAELRQVAAGISAMEASQAQLRALESLGRHYVSDRSILEQLLNLYANTRSLEVQVAVAGIFMRADPRVLDGPALLPTLMSQRLPAKGSNMVDALIRRLQANSNPKTRLKGDMLRGSNAAPPDRLSSPSVRLQGASR